MSARPILVVSGRDEAAQEMAEILQNAADTTLKPDAGDCAATFVFGVSGGSAVQLVADAIPLVRSDLSRWRMILCDERLVEEANPDSTYGAFRRVLLGNFPMLRDHFVKPLFTNPDEEAAAADYERKLRALFPPGAEWPRFHMLILGVGEDGHTASLFPGHPLLDERTKWVAAIADSPKPPPRRITLTLPAINAAERCYVAAMGAGKADIVKRILVDKEELPAYLVNPTDGVVTWLLDDASAVHVPRD